MRPTITKEFLEEAKSAGKTLKQLEAETGWADSTLGGYCKKFGIKFDRYSGKNIRDLTGQRFGRLVVKEQSKNHNKKTTRAIWFCECDCGNIKEYWAGALVEGLTVSCGCYRNTFNWKGYEDISSCFWSSVLSTAKKYNREFNITREYVWDIFIKQNKTCNLSGLPIFFEKSFSTKMGQQTASIDRIDSNKGYIDGNIQIVHKHINVMKTDFSQKEFIYYCSLVANFPKKIHQKNIV